MEVEVESRDKNGGQVALRTWRTVGPLTGPFTHTISLHVITSLARRDCSYLMGEKTQAHGTGRRRCQGPRCSELPPTARCLRCKRKWDAIPALSSHTLLGIKTYK